MDKEKILSKLKEDLQEARKVKNVIDQYISDMRDIYEAKNIKKRKVGSNFVAKEVFKTIDWAKSQLINPFVTNDTIVRLIGNTGDYGFALQTEKLLNYFFTKKFNRYNFMSDLVKTLLIEGTAVIRTGWEYEGEIKETEEVVYQINPETGQKEPVGSTIVEVEVPIVNKPTAVVVDNNDIYIDPTANRIEEIQFVIHKREVRLSDLEKSGLYENLDKVKKNIQNAEDINISTISTYDTEINKELTTNLSDDERKKIIMYEYWGNVPIDDEVKPMVICWIGDTIVRFDENPYPDKQIPYIIIPFIKEPNSIYGKSMTEIIDEYQRVKTGIIRGMFDDIAQSNNTQKGVKKGNLDPINYKRFINGEPFEFNTSPNDFYQGQYNRIPPEVFSVLQNVDQEKQFISGIVPLGGGAGFQSIYGSQASKTGQMTSLMLKELDMVTNIAENAIKPLLTKWTYYIYEFLEPEEIQDITHMQYVEPVGSKYENLLDDFTIDISTAQTDEVKASELAFLLQTLGNNLPFEMTKLIMSEIARLKRMPDLSQRILSYEPQPDPVQQQMAQLQLLKLQLEVQALQAQVQADTQLKQAKAKEAEAKALKENVTAIKQKYNVDFQQKMAELQAKFEMEMAKLREQMNMQHLKNQTESIPTGYGIKENPQQPSEDIMMKEQTM